MSAQNVRKMSDLYLELRSRIPIVAQQTHLGKARIQGAQDAVGLSNEAIARVVHISEKTWRRWKEAGAIPTASLPAVATALRLELKELNPAADAERLALLESEMRETQQALAVLPQVQDALARIEALLRDQADAAQSS